MDVTGSGSESGFHVQFRLLDYFRTICVLFVSLCTSYFYYILSFRLKFKVKFHGLQMYVGSIVLKIIMKQLIDYIICHFHLAYFSF